MKHLATTILFLCIASKQIGQVRQSFTGDSLDNYIKKGMSEWQIPAAAVCIVKNGKIIFSKGYGQTESENQRVDGNTLFMIGSNTKAFTATALALLEAEGKLSLNDPVKKWIPSFKLHDSIVSRELTIRDLLSHRIGLESFQGDFMFFNSDLTKEEVLERFYQLKLPHSFRSKWGYSNAAFLLAGEVIKAVTQPAVLAA